MVVAAFMPSNSFKSFQISLVNCRPRSVVTSSGTPYLDTQCRTRALATVLAVMSIKGTASAQREKRSMHVNR